MQLVKNRLVSPYPQPRPIFCLPSNLLEIKQPWVSPFLWRAHLLLEFSLYRSFCILRSLMDIFFFNGFLFTKLILATGVKVRIFCHFIHPSLPSPLPLVHPSMLMCVYVHKYTLFNVGILYILFMMKNTISCVSSSFLYVPKLSKLFSCYCIYCM